jgi:hypothetical protein
MKKLTKSFKLLKEACLKNLKDLGGEKYDHDKPFLFAWGKKWTINELIQEIENETEVGINQITLMMNLTCDLLYREKISTTIIRLTPEQEKKFSAWKKTFKKIPPEARGAQFGIKVVFTGIGNGIFGYNWKNDEIDLTDYSTW